MPWDFTPPAEPYMHTKREPLRRKLVKPFSASALCAGKQLSRAAAAAILSARIKAISVILRYQVLLLLISTKISQNGGIKGTGTGAITER